MSPSSYHITAERPEDETAIDSLHQVTFGPGRFARTAFRLREGIAPIAELGFSAWDDDRLIGSVRFTGIVVNGTGGLLLGPLAVLPGFTGRGIGKALVLRGLEAARQREEAFVLLVGDLPYYGPLGFQRAVPGQLTLPGPVDPARVLICVLKPDRLARLSGAVRPVRN